MKKNHIKFNYKKMTVNLAENVDKINFLDSIPHHIEELIIINDSDNTIRFETINIKNSNINSIYLDCKISNINNILTFLDNNPNDVTIYLKNYENHHFKIDLEFQLFIKNFLIIKNKNFNLNIKDYEHTLFFNKDKYFILKNTNNTIKNINKKINFFINFKENNITIKIRNLKSNYYKYNFENCNIIFDTDTDIENMNFIHCKIIPISFSFNLQGKLDRYSMENIKNKKLIKNINQINLIDNFDLENKIIIFEYLYSKIFNYIPSLKNLIILLIFNIIIGTIFFEHQYMSPVNPNNININLNYNSLLYSLDLALPINIGIANEWQIIFNEKNKYVNYYYYYMISFNKILWIFFVYFFYYKWKTKK